MKAPRRALFCSFLLFFAFVPPLHAQDTFVLEAARDNTLIESATGAFSNGAGPYVFAGRVDTTGDLLLRRALLYFDLSEIPLLPEQITDVALTLYVFRPETGSEESFTLHALEKPWGEGTSSNAGGIGDIATTGDATWVHTFFADGFWDLPGGDFAETSAADLVMGPRGNYTVSSDEMRLDVQRWLADPGSNHGWILLGDESPRVTVKSIASKDNEDAVLRPRLTITFTGDPLPVELTSFSGFVDGRTAHLRWETASERNNAGFDVEHAAVGSAFERIGFVAGAGTTPAFRTYRYAVPGLPNGQHVFRLKQIDFDGTFAYSPKVEVIVNVAGANIALDVYPNPTNNRWQIAIEVAEAQQVEVDVFDVLGRRAVQVFTGWLDAGVHILPVDAAGLSSNVYIVRVKGKKNLQHKQVVLEK